MKCQSFTVSGKQVTYSLHDNIRYGYGISALIKGPGGSTDLEIKDGAGNFDLTNDQMSPEGNPIDRSMQSMTPGIIYGNFFVLKMGYRPNTRMNKICVDT